MLNIWRWYSHANSSEAQLQAHQETASCTTLKWRAGNPNRHFTKTAFATYVRPCLDWRPQVLQHSSQLLKNDEDVMQWQPVWRHGHVAQGLPLVALCIIHMLSHPISDFAVYHVKFTSCFSKIKNDCWFCCEAVVSYPYIWCMCNLDPVQMHLKLCQDYELYNQVAMQRDWKKLWLTYTVSNALKGYARQDRPAKHNRHVSITKCPSSLYRCSFASWCWSGPEHAHVPVFVAMSC